MKGLHTSLRKGIVYLDVEYQVCKKGDKLTPEQARLLKLFDHMQAEFKVKVKMAYNKSSSTFKILDDSVESSGDQSDSEEEETMDDQENEQPKTKKHKKKTDENNNN